MERDWRSPLEYTSQLSLGPVSRVNPNAGPCFVLKGAEGGGGVGILDLWENDSGNPLTWVTCRRVKVLDCTADQTRLELRHVESFNF